MLRAKRAMDAVLATGCAFIDLPTVEDRAVLLAELTECGMVAAHLDGEAEIDVRALRERLGFTREEFALRYGLEVETLRNWEADRRAPDTTARSYLRAIANDPVAVERAYAPPPTARRDRPGYRLHATWGARFKSTNSFAVSDSSRGIRASAVRSLSVRSPHVVASPSCRDVVGGWYGRCAVPFAEPKPFAQSARATGRDAPGLSPGSEVVSR